jgi:putative transposase
VERLVGTMMRMVHDLPGTTFSNTRERREYDSDAAAALTLAELQRWMALAVACYHGEPHAGLGGRTPAGVWAEKVAESGVPGTVTNETAFLVDFLPVIRRSLTRTGFQLDHVQYYSDALKPLIAHRSRLDRVVLRRDPRDISRIWALHPETGEYLEVPYRTWSRPAISLWEQRAAVARLRERGRAEVDENALFSMVEQMRHIIDTATVASRHARRNSERRRTAPTHRRSQAVPPAPSVTDTGSVPVAPFEVIEQW